MKLNIWLVLILLAIVVVGAVYSLLRPLHVDVNQQILSDLGKSDYTIDKVVGNFAKGQMPMAYWIAKKADSKWKIVISGNGIPSCSEIDKYTVPKEIYGNCIEASGELRH